MKVQLLETVEGTDVVLGIVGKRKSSTHVYFINLEDHGDEYSIRPYPEIGDALEIDDWLFSLSRKDLEHALRNIRDEGKRKAAKKTMVKLKKGQKQCPTCGSIWGARKIVCECGWNFQEGSMSEDVKGIKEVLVDFYGETLEEDGVADKMAVAINKRLKGQDG